MVESRRYNFSRCEYCYIPMKSLWQSYAIFCAIIITIALLQRLCRHIVTIKYVHDCCVSRKKYFVCVGVHTR